MTNPNAPAAPALCQMNAANEIVGAQTGCSTGWELGLTKREHFAALALQGMLANPLGLECAAKSGDTQEKIEETYAADSVRFADLLIKALNK